MRGAAALVGALVAAGCIEAPRSAMFDASPDEDPTDAAAVPGEPTFYLAHGAPMTSSPGYDLVLVAERGNGTHAGVILPTGVEDLQAALQSAVSFDLDARAVDLVIAAEGVAAALLDGAVTGVDPVTGMTQKLDVTPVLTAPAIDVARFDGDARLVAAATDRLFVQKNVSDVSIELHLVGTTLGSTFMGVVPNDSGVPLLGVAHGTTVEFRPIKVDGALPELGDNLAPGYTLPHAADLAVWRFIEGSAQLLATDGTDQMIHWRRVTYDGLENATAEFAPGDLETVVAMLVVQMGDGQDELVLMGRRDDDLVVQAYINAVGYGGLAMGNVREWIAPPTETVPLLAAADLAPDLIGGANEIVLVAPGGTLVCLDVTDSLLLPSCGEAQVSVSSSADRPGW